MRSRWCSWRFVAWPSAAATSRRRDSLARSPLPQYVSRTIGDERRCISCRITTRDYGDLQHEIWPVGAAGRLTSAGLLVAWNELVVRTAPVPAPQQGVAQIRSDRAIMTRRRAALVGLAGLGVGL